MGLVKIMERFPTQQSCFSFLEGIRFKEGAYCPHCASVKVARKNEKKHVGRWNCYDCESSFRVTKGTIFHDTKIPLQKWFLGIVLVANAKKSLSSHQLARDLDMNQKSAWYMMTRIRAEMASKNDTILQGIIEADETYVGGKVRKSNKRDDDDNSDTKQAWTNKKPVIGLAERGGNVSAKAVDSITGVGVLEFILGKVDTEGSVLMTDESNIYQNVERIIERKTVNHKEQYVDEDVHTNTLEGFWGLLKRAWTDNTTSTNLDLCLCMRQRQCGNITTVNERMYSTSLLRVVLISNGGVFRTRQTFCLQSLLTTLNHESYRICLCSCF